MTENCNVFFTNGITRARIVRVIRPEERLYVIVEFPETAAKYFSNVRLDANNKFLGTIPTVSIVPDEHIKSINYYYYIGDSLDACPCSIDNFGWHETAKDEQS